MKGRLVLALRVILTISVGCSEVPLPGDKIAIGGYIECITGGIDFW